MAPNCGCRALRREIAAENRKGCVPERQFASSTSCHAIGEYWNSKFAVQRIFWFLLIVGMLGALTQQIYTRISVYFEYKASTEVSNDFRNRIEFPAVTICNFNRLFFPNTTEELEAMNALTKVSDPNYAVFASSTNASLWTEPLRFFDSTEQFSTSRYFFEKGFPLEDNATLFACRFGLEVCSAKDFEPIVTQGGKCYTFNADKRQELFQYSSGYLHGLSFIVDVLNWNYTEEPVVGSSEAGLIFQVHSKYEEPNVLSHGSAVPVGRSAYASLTQKNIKNMYQPWGKCNPAQERNLEYFRDYTLDLCMLDCFTVEVVSICGCHHFNQVWATDSKECTIEQMANCSTPLLAKLEREYVHPTFYLSTSQSCFKNKYCFEKLVFFRNKV